MIFFTELKSQDMSSIRGNVVDKNGLPVEYFHVVLRSTPDSSTLQYGAFIDGCFELNGLKTQKYILEISSMSYSSSWINFEVTKDTLFDLGEIILESFVLQEIVIAAKKPLFTQAKGKLVVHIQGTSLSDAGSLVDALRRSPGLIVDNKDNICVFGKGIPIIYIDDRELVSKDELTVLQSSDIDKIEIDRNPSSKYSASGHAVVRIRTKRSKSNAFSLLAYDNVTYGRRLSNVIGIQLNQKNKKIVNLFSYSYGDQNYKDYINAYEVKTLPDYILENNGNGMHKYGYKIHRLFLGSDYIITARQSVGIQFSGYWDNGDGQKYNQQKIRKTNNPTIYRIIQQDRNSFDNLYNANIYYQTNPDTLNSFTVILGYAYKKNESENLIDETNLNASSLFSDIKSNSDYSVYSVKADYKCSLFKTLTSTVGIKYSTVLNKGNSMFTNTLTNIVDYSSVNNINDKIAAGYFQVEKQLKKITIEGGIRFEYTNSKVRTESVTVDTAYYDFFPSLSLVYEMSDKFGVTLNYSRRINRPKFVEINPNIVYFDSLSYSVGNPFLRPTYSDNIELGLSIMKNISLTVGYTEKHDFIVHTALNDKANPDIICYTYNNINRSRTFSVGATLSKSFKHLSGSIEVYVDKPYTEVPYLNITLIRNQPTWYFAFRNDFTILKNLTINCNLNYQSAGDDGITHWDATCNLSAGAILKMFKQQMQISITVNDILNKADRNNWEDRFGNIISGMKSDQDNTWVRIGVRYNFNKYRYSVKKRVSNIEEIDRL